MHERSLVVRAAVACFKVCLLRYPSWLREEHGAEMIDVFRQMTIDQVSRRGRVGGVIVVALRTMRDLVRRVPPPLAEQPSPESRPSSIWSGTLEDAVFAMRSLRREPRFTLLVTTVLGIGVALNVVVFALLNAYLLRPLPFPSPDRVVSVRGAELIDWTEVNDLFERPVSWDLDAFTILGHGQPHMARGAWVTPSFLDVYGVQAALGRTFSDADIGSDAGPVAMISYDLWQQLFGGDRGVVGTSVQAFTSDRPDHAELFTIVGVLPEDFWYLNEYTEVLAPLRSTRAVYGGRLHPGVTTQRASAALTDIARRRMESVPEGFEVAVVPLQEVHVAAVRPTLLSLQSATALVLLIVCANAGVLLLLRSARRERELGVRRALGASNFRLLRQLVIEGATLTTLAGLFALFLAHVALTSGSRLLEARLGRSVPGGAEALRIDPTVALLALGLCTAVGIVFGLIPLFSTGRTALSRTLASSGRGSSASRGLRRARAFMVTAEVALSLTLLIGAGLMTRSAIQLQSRDLGFLPSGMIRGEVGLRQASYPEAADRTRFFSTLIDRVQSLPGVESAALSSSTVFTARFGPRDVEAADNGGVRRGEAVAWVVGEDYFDAMGARVIRGRSFSQDDGAGSQGVAVVSERLARSLWGSADPIGQRVRVPPFTPAGTSRADDGPWLRVVGVVADMRRDASDEQAGDVYRAYRQAEPFWLNVNIRQAPGASDVMADVRRLVAELDPSVPLSTVIDVEAAVEEATAPSRFLAALFTGFSAFAVLLAVLGLYGVIAYAARQRQREVAIRMALGAEGRTVTRLFVREGLTLVMVGLVLGSAGGLLLAHAIRDQLHGVGPADPATHGLLALALGVAAAGAVWIPASRAATTDPMHILREE